MAERSCTVAGCGRAVVARGWCSGHYDRWRRTGDAQANRPLPERRARGTCTCGRPTYAQGWCEAHYRRQLRTGDAAAATPVRSPDDPPAEPSVCAVATCSRPAEARGWRHGHYLRWDRTGDVRVDAALEPRTRSTCQAGTCGRGAELQGYCRAHFKRWQRHGDPRADVPIRVSAPRGDRFINHGYRFVPVAVEERCLTDDVSPVLEDGSSWPRHLGRPLLDEENVHHRNGDRLDNRLANLELWSTTQPKGQRVVDKLAWARELLRTYGEEEDLLRPDATRSPSWGRGPRVMVRVAPSGFEPPLPP